MVALIIIVVLVAIVIALIVMLQQFGSSKTKSKKCLEPD